MEYLNAIEEVIHNFKEENRIVSIDLYLLGKFMEVYNPRGKPYNFENLKERLLKIDGGVSIESKRIVRVRGEMDVCSFKTLKQFSKRESNELELYYYIIRNFNIHNINDMFRVNSNLLKRIPFSIGATRQDVDTYYFVYKFQRDVIKNLKDSELKMYLALEKNIQDRKLKNVENFGVGALEFESFGFIFYQDISEKIKTIVFYDR